MSYKPNILVIDCMEKNDVKGLRRALGTIIYTDRDFSNNELKLAIDYIVNVARFKGLFQEFDGSTPLMSLNKKTFVDDDFADAIFELQNNFCNERIEDVKTIGKKLYGTSQERVEIPSVKPSNNINFEVKSEEKTTKKSQSHKIVATKKKQPDYLKLALIGGAVVVTAGIAIALINKLMK